ncbi:hypothetical protein [Paraburkholderia humisilvae]|uniref:Uncharacterized protein n=1 Tax=Paraburkholderia humisilvae TaxID=627669 RepID=A0A6J5F1Z1_9BURK|nr:hypothetical protein [Paraburkholderia humisilvae]CAB3772850.1 hypothetical protein LMG29542_06995 [Paraburkholderia humisilvae]
MSQHRSADGLLPDAILKIMKPAGIYTIQHLAKQLSPDLPPNAEIRAAVNKLIAEGKVQVSGFFMRNATYRLTVDEVVEGRREELTEYAESLRRSVELANLTRRR